MASIVDEFVGSPSVALLLALEEMKQKTELVRLEVQKKKLNLIQEGKFPSSSDSETSLFVICFSPFIGVIKEPPWFGY